MHVESLKNDTHELIYKTETDPRHGKQSHGYQRGKGVEGISYEFAINKHIIVYKTDNQQGPTI